MEDRKFTVYSEPGVYLGGEIENGCLHLESDVFGEFDSEQHYSFSKEDTDKLFSVISFEDFCELCRREHLLGMDEFLEKNGIKPGVFTI